MKRSDFFMKIITAVLFLAVVSYIGVYVYNAAINTYVTAPAISYTEEEAYSVQGYVIRTETLITETGPSVLPIVGDGEKVASGQAVAVEYTSSESLETASELRALKLRISQLESPVSSIESACYGSVMALSIAVQSGNLSGLDELALSVESNIFSGGDESDSELPALLRRLESLENRSSGVRTVYAPVSGVFTHVIDGFEQIGPSGVSDTTPSVLADLFSAPSRANGVGKLITEFTWYYAAVMDAADTARLTAGRTVSVLFSGAYNAQVSMRVESVGRNDNGECIALFSCDRGIHEITSLRFVRADIVLDTVSGIRVPKEAIHLDDDGSLFVYLQTGVRAERVDVEILLETGDSYLVRDGIETGSPLRDGATIIVKANGLFDGKVVG